MEHLAELGSKFPWENYEWEEKSELMRSIDRKDISFHPDYSSPCSGSGKHSSAKSLK